MTPKPLTVEQAEVLADDLVAELATHPGDDDAVCAVMLRWLEVLDAQQLAQVSLAAMRTTFGRCLVPHPDRVPIDALTIDPTKAGATT